jgi:hypothetical protein
VLYKTQVPFQQLKVVFLENLSIQKYSFGSFLESLSKSSLTLLHLDSIMLSL